MATFARMPAWPPELPVRCAVYGSPLRLREDAGWRHEVGLAERGGCQTPWPEG